MSEAETIQASGNSVAAAPAMSTPWRSTARSRGVT
jgi:hypothetical protein